MGVCALTNEADLCYELCFNLRYESIVSTVIWE